MGGLQSSGWYRPRVKILAAITAAPGANITSTTPPNTHHATHTKQEAKGPAPAARGLGLESARASRAFATIAVLDVHALWRTSTRCSVFTRPLGDWRTAGHQAAASSLLAVSSFDGCAVSATHRPLAPMRYECS